jgi:hypothetical protein
MMAQKQIRQLVNPRMLKPWIEKIKSPKLPRGKVYVAVLTKRVSLYFPTRTSAEIYSAKVIARWIRLYDAALVTPQPASQASPQIGEHDLGGEEVT